jgi:hypothetical protein
MQRLGVYIFVNNIFQNNEEQYSPFLFLFLLSFAQNNLLWKGYFPYNEIQSLSQSPTAVFCCI